MMHNGYPSSTKDSESYSHFQKIGNHVKINDLFKMENTNKKETKIPAESKHENKSLRKKLGHPAGLPNQNSKEFIQEKVRESEKEIEKPKRR